jgi:hypothetical protein
MTEKLIIEQGVRKVTVFYEHYCGSEGEIRKCMEAGLLRMGNWLDWSIDALRFLVRGRETAHRVAGAVAVYLLLGLIWARLYQAVELVSPGAFRVPEGEIASGANLAYFSFVTLETLGTATFLRSTSWRAIWPSSKRSWASCTW